MKKARPPSQAVTRSDKRRPQAWPEALARPRGDDCPPQVLSFEGEIAYLRGMADILNARADEIESALARNKSAQQPKANAHT